MNEQDKELAKQAGISDYEIEDYDLLAMFANLIRVDEREACADIAENWNCNGFPRVGVAAQIRTRGNK